MQRTLPERGARVVPAKFSHFVLRSRCYEKSVAWWRRLLLADVAFANEMLTFMTYDDEHHRIAIANTPDLPKPPQLGAGVDHVAFTYATLGELLFTYTRLKEEGVEPHWCINHGPTTSLYYRDPEGNRVELQIDNFATERELRSWFAGGAFATNPIGVEFDPAKLLAKYLEGVSESELVQQGSA